MATAAMSDRSFRQWWRVRSATERSIVAGLALLLGLALLWVLLWQPLQRDALRLRRQLAVQGAALAQARREADEIAVLARQPASTPATSPRADLEALLAKEGLSATAIETLDASRLRLTFDNVAFDTLAPVLQSLQQDARLLAVEVSATARVEPGKVRAEVILTR
jgi:type II secretory pathway component PulM